LSHQEHRTAGRVAERLQEYGFTVEASIGGTGLAGVLANGDGPTVLLRAELDALPVREETGADYASTATAQDASGHEVPVAHACGHDLHMACMLGMAKLMADRRGQWNGTLLPLLQPAEETADGAQGMVDDGLLKRVPVPDVALAQHVLPGIAGTASTRPGPFMAAADSIRVTVYGRGGHASMPQHATDPVVLAAMIIVRLQTVVSREVTPGDTAVLTVGSVVAGSRSNLIPDHAVLELNVRSYSRDTRQRVLSAIQRIVRAECQASGSPRDPDFDTEYSFPVTANAAAATARVAAAFATQFGDHAGEIDRQTVSEDFSKIPDAAGVPYSYWGIGFTAEKTYRAAAKAGRLEDLPTNHSPRFLPPLQPTLRTGTEALTTAALAWLAP
jgi:amidohydrolase